MMDIIQKKVKLNIDQLLIDNEKQQHQKETRDNDSISTKMQNDLQSEIPLVTELNESKPFDQETKCLLKYSQYYGEQILQKFANSQILIELLRTQMLTLEKQSLIYFLNNVIIQDNNLHDLIFKLASSLDKDIRLAAVDCISKFKVNDEQIILSLIKKPTSTLELLNSHQKGLIISILEDQYQKIRINALRAIINFNRQSITFANNVLDIIITMLNDESDAVRIEAIQALLYYKKIEFNQHDSNAIKFNLIEQNFKLRKAIYELIGASIFTETLLDIFESVCKNIQKFPQDFIYIAKSIKNLAQKNQNKLQIQDIIKKEYLNKEPNVQASLNRTKHDNYVTENLDYVIRMIYAFYTQRSDNDPFYFPKHFAFLSDKYPELFQSNKVSPSDFHAFTLYEKYQQLTNEVFKKYKLYRMNEVHKVYNELQCNYEFNQDDIPEPPKEFTFEFRPNWPRLPSFQVREFKFLLPIDGTTLRVQSEFPLTIQIQGEFLNLKEPIINNYAIKIYFQDGLSEIHRIQYIEDNLINSNIEIQKKIIDFSQTVTLELINIISNIRIGNSVNILLQI